jgi:hypothetical protein
MCETLKHTRRPQGRDKNEMGEWVQRLTSTNLESRLNKCLLNSKDRQNQAG